MLQKDSIDFRGAAVCADEYSEINDDDDEDRVAAVERPSPLDCCDCLCKEEVIVSAIADDGVMLLVVFVLLRDVQVVSVLMTKSM
jgi:hypothetical protein